MRKPHLLRAGRDLGHPDRLVTFDVETRPATCVTDQSVTPCAACRRLAAGTHTPDDEIAVLTLGHARSWTGARLDFTDAGMFWDWLHQVCMMAGGPVWCVNHNISFDLMVLGWDAALTARGWTPKKIILPDPSGPFAVTWKTGKAVLHLVNLANWWGMRPLASIGAVIGTYKGGVDPVLPKYRHAVQGSAEWAELTVYCARDTDVVFDAVRMWSRFVTDHDLGPFRATQAGQALSAYTHRFLHHDVMIHTNRRALNLERSAYIGGRTEAFRIGSFEGDFHVLDVNSLYPFVMRDNVFPVALEAFVSSSNGIGIRELASLAKVQCVVVAVGVSVGTETQRIVPAVRDGRLLYPTGQFFTVLTTPELKMALEADIVVSIGDMCVYKSAPIFTDYVTELYELRLRYKEEGNIVWHEIVKVFLNSLYGKFGQYNHTWELEDINGISGTLVSVDIDTGKRVTYRSLGGKTHRRSTDRHEAWDSFPAIAAHVTGYARAHISRLVGRAGTVYYCDTDSLFVDKAGMARVASDIDPIALGSLKHELSGGNLVIRGLKDYTIGDKTRLKGVRRNAIPVDGGFRQTQFRGIAGAMRAGEPDIARIGSVVKRPTGIYHKGVVSDTYVIPVHLEEF